MADLVIRGLHLPKSLGGEETHLDIRLFSDGTVIMATRRPPYYKKFDAVPLPEGHGRLIDADALMDVIHSHDYPLTAHFNSTDNGMFTVGIQQAVDEAPTIVPAEGGTDECSEN